MHCSLPEAEERRGAAGAGQRTAGCVAAAWGCARRGQGRGHDVRPDAAGPHWDTRLLFYCYLPNGSLSGLLHSSAVKGAPAAEWGVRFDVELDFAHAVAYLHHDCVPAILHGD
ncbi:hypothetical protein ACP70R_030262 [Stipagrostis hirtigluma subsp. patula]